MTVRESSRIAAALLILLIVSGLLYQFVFSSQRPTRRENLDQLDQSRVADSSKPSVQFSVKPSLRLTTEQSSSLATVVETTVSIYLSGDVRNVYDHLKSERAVYPRQLDEKAIVDAMANANGWFWQSLRIRSGEGIVYTSVINGVRQPVNTLREDENYGTSQVDGAACPDVPIAKRFAVEVQFPIEYTLESGHTVPARLGFHLEWCPNLAKWVPVGSTLYDFPVNTMVPGVP